jgi:hypothetical protein
MSVLLIRLALVLPLVTLGAARAADSSSVAFVGVTVIDVVAGKPVPGQTVVVADGKITELRGRAAPADGEAISLCSSWFMK